MRRIAAVLLWLALLPAAARAQTGFVGPDGLSRYPGVTILCPSGTRAAPCSFGGGSGGSLSITLGGAPVAAGNPFPVVDPALDGLIGGGALAVSGTVGLAGTVAGAPGGATAQAVSVQGAAGGVPVPVSGSFWPAVQPVSAASLPLPSGAATLAAQNAVQAAPGSALPGSATAIGVANAAGNLAVPVLAADGGLPAHVTNFPASQAVVDGPLDALIAGGALAVSAASLPLPAGAAKAVNLTNGQAGVAPGAAAASVSTLIGCVYNATLPGFASGQQGAVQCDASGRQIVTTVPSAVNVPSYLQAVSSGGAALYRAINAAGSAMAAAVKASGGMLYGFDVCNGGAGAVFFRLFNLGAAPTVGSSVPAVVRLVPAGGCATFSSDVGVVFGTGIAVDVTSGGLADADTAVVAAANQVVAQIYYR